MILSYRGHTIHVMKPATVGISLPPYYLVRVTNTISITAKSLREITTRLNNLGDR